MKLLMVVVVPALYIFWPEMAHAATQGLFTPAAEDKSISMIMEVLFPDGGTTPGPAQHVLAALNGGILLIGGVLASYTLIAGTMHTAHDGEMLGKKWSSMWVPIRTALGTAAIIPTSSGLCSIQLVIVWLTIQGIGFADTVWTAFATHLEDVALAVPSVAKKEVAQAASELFFSHVCVASVTKEHIQNPKWDPNTNMSSSVTSDVPLFAGRRALVIDFSQKSKAAFGSDLHCGRFEFYTGGKGGMVGDAGGAASNEDASAQKTVASGLLNSKEISSGVEKYVLSLRNVLMGLHHDQMVKLNLEVKKLAEGVVNGPVVSGKESAEQVLSAINNISDVYVKELRVASQAAAKKTNVFSLIGTEIAKEGWLYAGTYFSTLARVQDMVYATSGKLPSIEYTPPSESGAYASNDLFVQLSQGIKDPLVLSKSDFDQDVIGGFAAAAAKGCGTALAAAAAITVASGGVLLPLGGLVATAAGICVIGGSLAWQAHRDPCMSLGSVSACISQKILNNIKAGNGFGPMQTASTEKVMNPLLATQALGNSIITAGWGIFAAGGVALTLGSKFMLVAFFLFGASITVLAAGASLSVVIPMLPYTIWLGVIFGWIILVIEAVIAAPLWAIVHLHPDGDDVVGKGGQGYMLVFSLIVRPTLMILGLIFALLVMPIFGSILNETFGRATSIAIPNDPNGYVDFDAVALIAIIGVYVGLMLTVVKKACSLIHVIPDEILKWIGGHASPLGQSAQEAVGNVEKHHAAVVGGVVQQASGIAQQGSQAANTAADTKRSNASNAKQTTALGQAALEAKKNHAQVGQLLGAKDGKLPDEGPSGAPTTSADRLAYQQSSERESSAIAAYDAAAGDGASHALFAQQAQKQSEGG